MGNLKSNNTTRDQILCAALRAFSEKGYAAASVQEIVTEARVSKPALYYYFKDKADLFLALVDKAINERYRLVQEAAGRGVKVGEKLEEIAAAVFDFALRNRELMRLQFASAFSPPGQMPGYDRCRSAGMRNFELLLSLMEQGQRTGELAKNHTPQELAMAVAGLLNVHVMVRLLFPESPLDRNAARRSIKLFMEGAGTGGGAASGRHRKRDGNGSTREPRGRVTLKTKRPE